MPVAAPLRTGSSPDARLALAQALKNRPALRVDISGRTDPDVDVPPKASEIDQVARESVSRLGLKLNRLRVKIHVAPTDEFVSES